MKALLAVGLVLALAACQAKPDVAVDNTRQTFEAICAGADLGYVVFESFKEKVKPQMAVRVEASYAAAKIVCVTPPSNSAEALILALRAMAAFNRELAAAKAATNGDST